MSASMSRGALLVAACSLACGASPGSDANQLVQAVAVPPVVCELPHAECDGDSYTACETNLKLTRAHCGSCGRACDDGLVCFEGECSPGAAQIHTGTFATCAVMVSGAVRCWGRVGDASFDDWQGAAEVRVGNRSVCARFEDHVRCRALEGSADGEVRLPLPGKAVALRVQAPFMDRVLVVGDGGELYLLGYEMDIARQPNVHWQSQERRRLAAQLPERIAPQQYASPTFVSTHPWVRPIRTV